MTQKRLRVIALTHGGSELAVTALAALECVEIAGIFVETDTIRPRGLRERTLRSIRYDGYAATAAKIVRKGVGISRTGDDDLKRLADSVDLLRRMAAELTVPFHLVSNYHLDDSLELMRAANADLGVLLGTNILKEPVFSIPRLGSINLHQGLAPLYRGGPSVFWELYNGEREVGLTIHSVAPKVDTGDIILQRTLPLEYDYSYGLGFEQFIEDYRRNLRLPCANLLAEAVRMIAEGTAQPKSQDPGLGTRYRLPVKKEKDKLRHLLRERRRGMDSWKLTRTATTGD